MGEIHRPCRVKLIAALISNNTELFERARVLLEKKFKNKVDFESGIMDFIHTDYYNDEMGLNLKRKFLTFEKTVHLKDIENTKLISNKIEKELSRDGKRLVNIDPGYMDLCKLVLFSTKDYSHRIHTAHGIFSEVTLYFKGGTFNAWPWTYPDYRTNEYILLFNSIRERYKDTLKGPEGRC